MDASFEVVEGKLTVKLTSEDDLEGVLLGFFHGATPTFKINADNDLEAVLETPFRG